MPEHSAAPLPITICPARPDEAGAVVSVLQDAARWMVSQNIDQWLPEEFTDDVVARWQAAGMVWLAWSRNDAVGTVSLAFQDEPLWRDVPGAAAYLHKLAVRRSVAGRRVSHALLAAAEAEAGRRGLPAVRLDCWAGNTALRHFYAAAGYALRAIVPEHTWECALFEKAIPATP
jgi:GNAT superfamily N-acetyltransferase